MAVCSTGTKYGWAPSVRSRARSSIFGPSAESTTGTGTSGSCAMYGAASMPSRYSRMVVSGGRYFWPRASATMWWLAPIPSTKRPGKASPIVAAPAFAAAGSRA